MAYQSEIEKLTAQWNAKPEQYFAPLADAYRKAGDIDMALEVIRAGLTKRPNYLSAHIVLGRCFLDQKNDGEAAKAFEKVLEFDAENIIALRVLGEIGERRGDLESAHKWVKRLLEVDPMNDEAQEALKRLAPAVAPMPVAAAPPPPAPEPEPMGPPAALSGFEPTSFSSAPTKEVAAFKTGRAAPAPAPAPPPAPPAEHSGPDVFQLEPAEPAMPDLAAMGAVSTLGVERAESAIEPSSPAAAGSEPMAFETEQDMNLKAAPSSEFETAQDAMPVPTETAPAAAPELVPLDEPESQPLPLMDFSEPEPPTPEPVATLDFADNVETVAPAASSRRSSQSLRAPGGIPLIMPDDAPASPPPPPPPSPAPVAVPESQADTVELEPVITETMAEVYLKQGLVHEAREVYRKLVDQRPADAGLRSRLAALEQRVSAAPPASAPAARPRVAAVETGGQSARTMLAQVLASRPATPTPAPAAPGSAAATLDAAFADEPPPGAPTSEAGDELSLAAVFGEEPAPAPGPARSATPQVPGAPGFSFDEFFGGKKEAPKPAGSAAAPAPEAEASPSDFLTWLKGLKS